MFEVAHLHHFKSSHARSLQSASHVGIVSGPMNIVIPATLHLTWSELKSNSTMRENVAFQDQSSMFNYWRTLLNHVDHAGVSDEDAP